MVNTLTILGVPHGAALVRVSVVKFQGLIQRYHAKLIDVGWCWLPLLKRSTIWSWLLGLRAFWIRNRPFDFIAESGAVHCALWLYSAARLPGGYAPPFSSYKIRDHIVPGGFKLFENSTGDWWGPFAIACRTGCHECVCRRSDCLGLCHSRPTVDCNARQALWTDPAGRS